MKRINVLGTSGSGKSFLARRLAAELNVKYIEMDALFWRQNWVEPTDEVFFAALRDAIRDETWVLDGNYSRASAIKWERVDTIVWVDYGFFRTFAQILVRSIKRAWNRDEIWPGTGNTESFYKCFCSRKSVILWMLTNYHKNKIKYGKLMHSDQHSHIKFIRLRSPKQAREFIAGLS